MWTLPLLVSCPAQSRAECGSAFPEGQRLERPRLSERGRWDQGQVGAVAGPAVLSPCQLLEHRRTLPAPHATTKGLNLGDEILAPVLP